MLADVDILHYDPLSAANFINSVWDDVGEWWHSEEVKKAKRNFVKEFANLTDNSKDEFFSQLIRIYKAQDSKN
jgi:putative transferase (TIGR04331 family)